jgi:GMP synthase (glutamine-hydrolysing)
MILIINICRHELHYFEFVKPVEDIVKNLEEPYITKHYSELTYDNIRDAHRIIICGTSLMDFDYEKHKEKFSFILQYPRPILGICGGMQLICIVHGCKSSKGIEIGMVDVNFNGEFLGMNGTQQAYALHQSIIKDDDIFKKTFKIYARSGSEKKCVQAIRHVHKNIYGVLFHPEVRHKDLIVNFIEKV